MNSIRFSKRSCAQDAMGLTPNPQSGKLAGALTPNAPKQDVLDDARLLTNNRAKTSRLALPKALAEPARNLRQITARAARVVAPLVPYAVVGGTVACLIGAARGYPCTGYDSDSTQNFSDTNNTIFGYIHGWFSDCYDYAIPCGSLCSNNVCTTTYCTETATDETPSHYVSSVADAVKNCGFELLNNIPVGAATRIANGLLEKNRWVKIVVNTLNLTDVTDPSVLCLHGIQ